MEVITMTFSFKGHKLSIRYISCSLLLLTSLLTSIAVHAAPGDIVTVAGTGTSGFSGDGGPATAAQVAPWRVAVDSAGNILISDYGRIRKVGQNGIISTVAGDGANGYNTNPQNIAVDSVGNVYSVENINSRILKADLFGMISTVAGNGTRGYSGDGGPATAAAIYPSDIAVDSAGNLYIADSSNNRIRKVDTSGMISTIAGNGTQGYSGDGGPATAAQLASPSYIAIDSVGSLYIGDCINRVTRKVDPSGVISTVRGSSGVCSVQGVDSAGNMYYIANDFPGLINKIDPFGVISTVAGNGSYGCSGDGGPAIAAGIDMPNGLAVDSVGNIYISDYACNNIRKVDPSGAITRFAGNPGSYGSSGNGGPATAAALGTPWDVAVDSVGNVYIADYGNDTIRKVDTSGIISTVGNGVGTFSGDGGPATAAAINATDIAVDLAGNIFIADDERYVIRKVGASGTISTVAGNRVNGVEYIGSRSDGGPATAAQLYSPNGVTVDSAGNIYISETDFYNTIRKVTPSGIISTIAGDSIFGSSGYSGDGGPATAAQLSYPRGLAVDLVGNLYIADSGNSVIRKVAPSGIISTIAGNGTSGYSGDGGPATAAQLDTPWDVAVDSAGNIYIADSWNNCIRKVDPTGVITTVAGNGTQGYSGDGGPATGAQFYIPFGVAVDLQGNIYIADSGNNRVRKVFAFEQPVAHFTWKTDLTLNYNVIYDASASICPAGTTCTYTWSTGETGITASHAFANESAIAVTLTVSNSHGSSISSVVVTPKYVASTPTAVSISGTQVSLYTATVNYSLSGGVAPYTVKATWGDGTVVTTSGVTAGANAVSHAYKNSGSYPVTITATDSGVNNKNVTTSYANASVTIVQSTATVSGRVTKNDGTTGIGSASVTLKLNGVAKKLVYTDASGNFTITNVAPGVYIVTAAKSGYTFPTSPTVDASSSSVSGVSIKSTQ
jgi:hypothetical protein